MLGTEVLFFEALGSEIVNVLPIAKIICGYGYGQKSHPEKLKTEIEPTDRGLTDN